MASPSNLSDDLFGDSSTTTGSTSITPAASPPPPPAIASSSSSIPSFVPRALKKRIPASTSKPLITQASLLPRATPAPVPVKKEDLREVQRLEQILCGIESSFSNHGISYYRSSGLMDKFRQGTEWIHLSLVLNLPPVRALTGILGDLRKAVELRESNIIKVDETGYQIARKESMTSKDWQELDKVDPTAWDQCSLHIENIPFNPSISSAMNFTEPTSFSLVSFLSSALETPIQRLVLPHLYDPTNPTNLSLEDEEEEGEREGENNSQSQAFANSLKLAQDGQGEGKKAVGLPRGGGKFRGFAFIVLRDRGEVERVLKEWGNRERDKDKVLEETRDEEMGDSEGKEGKGKGKRREISCQEKARKGGLKVMPYTRWLELKTEYLAYRKTLNHLLQAQQSGSSLLDQLRNPPATKDAPPHLQQQQTSSSDPSSKRGSSKRASSPSLNNDPPSSKRTKLSSSTTSTSPSLTSLPLPPTTIITRHTRPIRTPSPLPPSSEPLDLSSDTALSITGAYPLGCVLWVRNVNEKSSKTSLKSLVSKLLENLQEGSGKGVEFVDYEKGLETCYIRFSSSSLANLTQHHLSSTQTFHLTPTALSPKETLSKEELNKVEREGRRCIVSEKLEGERERSYWKNLPESTRKSARLSAGGKVGLVKMPRGTEVEEVEGGGMGAGGIGGGGGGKRKKPSRM